MRSPLNARAGDDAGAHLVDEVHHLLLARVGVLFDAVELERLGRAAAALVQRRDEAGATLRLLQLILIHIRPFFFIRQSSAARIASRTMAGSKSDRSRFRVRHSD